MTDIYDIPGSAYSYAKHHLSRGRTPVMYVVGGGSKPYRLVTARGRILRCGPFSTPDAARFHAITATRAAKLYLKKLHEKNAQPPLIVLRSNCKKGGSGASD